MDFGFGWGFMNGRTRADSDVYSDALRLVELAEERGFDSVWTVEHHFTGHSPIPDPLQMLTWLSARTNRVRLGTAVTVLPWHDPVRLAEQIAVLDLLSGGRTCIGFGRGSSAVEYGGIGVNQSEGHARLREGYELISRLLKSADVDHRGEMFEVSGLTIRPRPAFAPQDGFFVAAHSEASAAIAGEMGSNLLFSPEADQQYTDALLSAYENGLRNSVIGPSSERRKAIHLYVCVDDNGDLARLRARQGVTRMVRALASHYESEPGRVRSPEGYLEDDVLKDQVDMFMDKHLFGTPSECVEKLAGLQRRFGFDEFIGEFMFGDISLDECMSNVGTFSTKVMPQLR